ncbi:methylated-DNA--protein-cysteine methyltransferase [mine drainage metagenome]|uniref:methylated-DNA--[protein]-cysteine S-methyltransferase n=1 Tax=mine drainage metagenome TaxID=410659 RepID=A0A1J5Q4A6_9ZZZZ
MNNPLSGVTLKTPVGPLALISDGATLLGAAFGDIDELAARLSPVFIERGLSTVKSIPGISDEVQRYFDGDLRAFDHIKVKQPGGVFSQNAWSAMRKVKPGALISYADLAAKSGSPAAVRAAGSACARNLIAPIIPCHRIVRSDGSLGGYGFGLPTKTWLLKHEGAL